MGLARLDVPGIVVTAGPMISGRLKIKGFLLFAILLKLVGRKKCGDISQEELDT